jgi:hypothetical protein
MSTYYEDLGVMPTATLAEIKKQYRSKALLAHPDAPTGSDAAFVRVSTAYECLSNALTRREYDTKLVREAQPVVTPVASSPHPSYSSPASARTAAYNGTYAPRAVSIHQTPFGKFALFLGLVILLLLARAAVSYLTAATAPTPLITPSSTSSSSSTPTGIQNVDPTKNPSNSNGSNDTTPSPDTTTSPSQPAPSSSPSSPQSSDPSSSTSPTTTSGSTPGTTNGTSTSTTPSQPSQPVSPTKPLQ